MTELVGSGRRFAALALALGFVASTANAAIRPRYGGTLLWGFVEELVEFDPLLATSPLERHVARQLFAGLYRFGPDGEPVPDLVERAEILEGGEVKLTLHRASFHDGRPVRAEDVRASLERFVTSRTAGAALAVRGGSFARVVSEREVVLHIAAVPVLWPWLLADVRAGIVPAEGDRPIGAGPFRVAKRSPESLSLEGWDLHHRGRPLFDGCELRSFSDERALVLGHRHQGVDVAEVAAPVSGAQGRASVAELVVLRLNPVDPALAEIATRSALVDAVGRDALVDVVLGGLAEKRTTLLPFSRVGADPSSDRVVFPESAPRLRGVGRPANLSLRLAFPVGRDLRMVAERLRVDLYARGIEARLDELSAPALRAALAAASYQLLLLPVVLSESSSALMLTEIAMAAELSLPSELLRALVAVDPWQQTRELHAAERLLLADVVLVPLYRRQRTFLVREAVRDLEVDAAGSVVLEGAWRWPSP